VPVRPRRQAALGPPAAERPASAAEIPP